MPSLSLLLAQGRHPHKIITSIHNPAFITRCMQKCLLNNEYVHRWGSSRSITMLLYGIPLQRAWTLLHSRSIGRCRRKPEREEQRERESGGDKCAALCERRQEAAQHVRIQMPASPSHPLYWCTSTHSFNCVWVGNVYLAAGRSGARARVNAGVRRLYSKCCMELLRTVQIASYQLLQTFL